RLRCRAGRDHGLGRGRLRAVALRGLLAADRRADGVRDPARRQPRGRHPGGRRARRGVRRPGHARRRRRAHPGDRRTARRPRAPRSHGRGRPPPGARALQLACGRHRDRRGVRGGAGRARSHPRPLRPDRREGPRLMLTVDFDRLGLRPGDRVLDMGCGGGRHAFEMYRRGADVIAFDQDADELAGVREVFSAMREKGEVPAGAEADVKEGDALSLPFADGEFDRIVASEVLEHIWDDVTAIKELVRVLRPGGTLAITVPRWLPEVVNWKLSAEYHNAPGGHIRIYTDHE